MKKSKTTLVWISPPPTFVGVDLCLILCDFMYFLQVLEVKEVGVCPNVLMYVGGSWGPLPCTSIRLWLCLYMYLAALSADGSQGEYWDTAIICCSITGTHTMTKAEKKEGEGNMHILCRLICFRRTYRLGSSFQRVLSSNRKTRPTRLPPPTPFFNLFVLYSVYYLESAKRKNARVD